ncbi:hypothetical protein HYH03_019144 [Edaphochlamys debaryana]|uniref:Uncharacterized protein n=1 Tax=Edaphochlamys debaryana TaxID=47281 RepID=A0A835XIS7_9CHLO|nr:hypothetical protein HYH03_019144 [Edaphochlamys debaryana]|eukprot:KAG2481895.1 hypothetical protein HYH03_019144 [Edaphochlamys debaryana]
MEVPVAWQNDVAPGLMASGEQGSSKRRAGLLLLGLQLLGASRPLAAPAEAQLNATWRVPEGWEPGHLERHDLQILKEGPRKAAFDTKGPLPIRLDDPDARGRVWYLVSDYFKLCQGAPGNPCSRKYSHKTCKTEGHNYREGDKALDGAVCPTAAAEAGGEGGSSGAGASEDAESAVEKIREAFRRKGQLVQICVSCLEEELFKSLPRASLPSAKAMSTGTASSTSYCTRPVTSDCAIDFKKEGIEAFEKVELEPSQKEADGKEGREAQALAVELFERLRKAWPDRPDAFKQLLLQRDRDWNDTALHMCCKQLDAAVEFLTHMRSTGLLGRTVVVGGRELQASQVLLTDLTRFNKHFRRHKGGARLRLAVERAWKDDPATRPQVCSTLVDNRVDLKHSMEALARALGAWSSEASLDGAADERPDMTGPGGPRAQGAGAGSSEGTAAAAAGGSLEAQAAAELRRFEENPSAWLGAVAPGIKAKAPHDRPYKMRAGLLLLGLQLRGASSSSTAAAAAEAEGMLRAKWRLPVGWEPGHVGADDLQVLTEGPPRLAIETNGPLAIKLGADSRGRVWYLVSEYFKLCQGTPGNPCSRTYNHKPSVPHSCANMLHNYLEGRRCMLALEKPDDGGEFETVVKTLGKMRGAPKVFRLPGRQEVGLYPLKSPAACAWLSTAYVDGSAAAARKAGARAEASSEAAPRGRGQPWREMAHEVDSHVIAAGTDTHWMIRPGTPLGGNHGLKLRQPARCSIGSVLRRSGPITPLFRIQDVYAASLIPKNAQGVHPVKAWIPAGNVTIGTLYAGGHVDPDCFFCEISYEDLVAWGLLSENRSHAFLHPEPRSVPWPTTSTVEGLIWVERVSLTYAPIFTNALTDPVVLDRLPSHLGIWYPEGGVDAPPMEEGAAVQGAVLQVDPADGEAEAEAEAMA